MKYMVVFNIERHQTKSWNIYDWSYVEKKKSIQNKNS